VSFSTIVQLYRGGQFYWRRKPPTCRKSLTNNCFWVYIKDPDQRPVSNRRPLLKSESTH